MERKQIHDQLISLAEAARHPMMPCRDKGRTIHKDTLHRWATNGLRGRNLKTVLVGGIRCTTEAWLYEFIFGDQDETRPTPFPITHRQRRARRAERDARAILGLPPKEGGAA